MPLNHFSLVVNNLKKEENHIDEVEVVESMPRSMTDMNF